MRRFMPLNAVMVTRVSLSDWLALWATVSVNSTWRLIYAGLRRPISIEGDEKCGAAIGCGKRLAVDFTVKCRLCLPSECKSRAADKGFLL